jgi:hypothetical protein
MNSSSRKKAAVRLLPGLLGGGLLVGVGLHLQDGREDAPRQSSRPGPVKPEADRTQGIAAARRPRATGGLFHLTGRTRETSPAPEVRESFDRPSGGWPRGWSHWQNSDAVSCKPSTVRALSAPNSLAIFGPSSAAARVWLDRPLAADVQASAALYLDSLIQAFLLVRGSGLDTARPSYYAATVARGMEVQLTRVAAGKATVLARLKSTGWVSEKWVRITLQARGDCVSVRVLRTDTSEYLGADGRWRAEPAWAIRRTDKALPGAGRVGLGRAASYSGTIYFDDVVVRGPEAGGTDAAAPAPTRQQADLPAALPRPTLPRHYSHVRIAALAYAGNPMGPFEDRLLRESVDLVVPEPAYLPHIRRVAPRTPALVYTNTSNLYLDLLTDWYAFADARGLDREAAFYHATRPQPFRGDSPSSQPVTWFWSVLRGGRSLTDLTYAARSGTHRLPLAAPGEALYLGYPERFREVHLKLVSGGRGGWSAVLEYVREVDGSGRPSRWALLPLRANTTGGWQRAGQVLFDPPADWKAALLGSRPRSFYVRLRPAGRGSPPVAQTVLGRDYVQAHGTHAGVIPVFDFQADANHDGYLDDAEYARRASGKDARFVYESRMLTESYGQMRFPTNPSGAGFRAWAVDYHRRLLRRHPLAAGLFMDNCDGRPPLATATVREPLASYARDYGVLLQAVSRAIAPRWVLANLPLNARADPLVRYNPAYMIEFAIRPLAHNYVYFEDLAAGVARRAALTSPPPLVILDSYPQGGAVTEARLQLATLAYYYLLADPQATFLMLYGGYEPSTPWQRHWQAAVAHDVGRPTGRWSMWTSGTDPSNPRLTYRVYRRRFTKALILYKPLSHARGFRGRPATGDETATRHDLGGAYRPLRADATLGNPTTSIALRNGEGAILIPGQ